MTRFKIAARQQRWAEEDAKRDAVEWDGDYGNDEMFLPETYIRAEPKVGRNDPCPCGSGKKYKKCCLDKDEVDDFFSGQHSLQAHLVSQSGC